MSDRIKELEDKIKKARDAYYNGEPVMSDKAYDALEDELRDLAPKHPLLNQVGATPDGKLKWEKFSHPYEMTSLNKVNDPEELSDWLQNASQQAHISPDRRDQDILYWSEKLDGISIALYYEEGTLENAVTRGDGDVGEDILANVVLMKGAPRELDKDITGMVRGEIVLPFSDWERELQDYSNPRNAASGIAKVESRNDAHKCQLLKVYAYDCFLENEPSPQTEFEKFHRLQNLGFYTPNHGGPYAMDEIANLYREYEDTLREKLNYDIDGLVIRFNASETYDSAGKRNGKPHGAIALKFASETAVTTLNNIKWQVGNTGRVTPVAVFDEVNLFGAKVKKASVYNVAYIEDLSLNTGDEILVERANDVIPRVLEVTESRNSGTVDIPDACPVCDSDLEMDGEHLVCNSVDCDAQITGKLKAWIDALGILDWGDFILNKLVEEGLVEEISDLYELDEEALAQLRDRGDKKVGMKTAKKLMRKLRGQDSLLLSDFLGGLRIELCRQSTFQKLVDAGYDSLEAIQDLSKLEMRRVEGIGPKRAEKLYHGLQDNETLISDLQQYVTIESASGGLEGKKICLTGSMSKTRSEIKQDIKEAGGQYKGMSSKVDYLVAADPSSGSSKIKKADKYSIPVITEQDLYDMM